jgi:hypothetical protein
LAAAASTWRRSRRNRIAQSDLAPYTRDGDLLARDAVVAWEACIDQNGTYVEHVEVRTTHVGLGFLRKFTRSSPSGSLTMTSRSVNRRQMTQRRQQLDHDAQFGSINSSMGAHP